MKNNDWGARSGGSSAPSEPANNATNANSKSDSIANPIANPIDGDEIVLGGPDRTDGPAKPAKPDEKAQADHHEAPRNIGGLLQQGRGLFRNGRLQQAIHVWTRILFLDRNNRAARDAIDQAKRVIAERQRELDALVLAAGRCEASGDRRGALQRVNKVLSLDPRHAEGRSLLDKIEEQERRSEARAGTVAGKPLEDDEISKRRRRRIVAKPSIEAEPASPLKMAAFLFSALCLFAAGALYLYLNWDFLVSAGLDSSSLGSGPNAAPNSGSLGPRALPSLPTPSELHYFNGARLHSKGLYREALAELALVDRGSPNFEEARSLILRIEERLLRGSVMAGVPAEPLTPVVQSPKGE